VTVASGDWSVSETTTDGTATLNLPGEPLRTPRLSIRFITDEQVVGFHGTLLPIGEFAAG
ncbi:MAG: hypothetical protein KJO18_02355, partial [Acidimicrobiia bacterium]|nr:hypothetical protein [Acidimicrobiia bacterium]